MILAPQWPGALNASEILIERRLAGPPPGCCPWAIAAAHWHSTPGIIAATARRGVLRLQRRPAARRPNGHPHPSAGAVRGQRLSALQVATARNGSKCSALQVRDTQRAIKAPLAGVLDTNREVPAQLRENSSNTEPPSGPSIRPLATALRSRQERRLHTYALANDAPPPLPRRSRFAAVHAKMSARRSCSACQSARAPFLRTLLLLALSLWQSSATSFIISTVAAPPRSSQERPRDCSAASRCRTDALALRRHIVHGVTRNRCHIRGHTRPGFRPPNTNLPERLADLPAAHSCASRCAFLPITSHP